MDENKDNSGTERQEEVIELQAVAGDTPKRVGEMIEAAFLAKVCKLRIPVCKPWGDSERYDFVVDWGKGFWSVQVKGGVRGELFYTAHAGRRGKVFTKEDMDFVVVHIAPEDLWYVVPIEIAEGATALWFNPRSTRSRFEKYREACTVEGGTFKSLSQFRSGSFCNGGASYQNKRINCHWCGSYNQVSILYRWSREEGQKSRSNR